MASRRRPWRDRSSERGSASTEVDVSNVFVSLGTFGGLAYLALVLLVLHAALRLAVERRDAVSLAALGTLVVVFGQWLNGGFWSVAPLVWLTAGFVVASTESTMTRMRAGGEVPVDSTFHVGRPNPMDAEPECPDAPQLAADAATASGHSATARATLTTRTNRRLRICAFGWVEPDAGSVASANYILLRALIESDIEIDFFANPRHVPEPKGLSGPTFRYVPAIPPWPERVSPRLRRLTSVFLYPAVRAAWKDAFLREALPRHVEQPYQLLLSLGTLPEFTIVGVPTTAWLQASPQTELEAIRMLRKPIVSLRGHIFYHALVAYYGLSVRRARRQLRFCDNLIVGSQWSLQKLSECVGHGHRLHALPYPVDLGRFTPGPPDPDLGRPLILAVGRLDPRKRIDLLVDGFRLVRRQIPTARLLVVGQENYGRGAARLLAREDAVEYVAHLPRSELVPLFREATVLVQPSMYENFGSAVAEALACGTPVVVGSTNGTSEFVSESSQVFQEYTPESVASAITKVIEERRRSPHRVGIEARAAAVRWFEPTLVAARLVAVMVNSARVGGA